MASAQTHRAMGTQITVFHMGLEDEDVCDLWRRERKYSWTEENDESERGKIKKYKTVLSYTPSAEGRSSLCDPHM